LVGRASATSALFALLALPLAARFQDQEERTASQPVRNTEGSEGCLSCHAGIEPMHPEAWLTCVDCHGGDGEARLQLEAHVPRPAARLEDERTPARDKNLAWRRFQNPMDLRVAEETCGGCHETDVEHLFLSLHGTTAGHLSDGYYEMGLQRERGSKYSVFPVTRPSGAGGEVSRLVQVPAFMRHLPEDRLSTHYTDLARKECMQCHLWSEGRAVEGRVGFDGDYRGEGCAACHVVYARDGLSESGDAARQRGVPGHPRRHEMTRAPDTATCTSCHYGDASIGLHYRGLSQLPPGAPGGPDIPGTTDRQLNRVFYLNDPEVCPPDVHYERGMHCIDCHTKGDVMGDGALHGQMEHAVEISCQACHGTFSEPSSLRTERGTPLTHLRRDGDRVVMTGKVSGREHAVPQVAHIVDPEHEDFDPEAARAMTPEHEGVACYTCHAGWNVNFLGFHFSRNASLSQLDILSGKRTPGRVTTLEKVFATWKSFYAGLDESGAVAPYLTGFSTMGSVWDEDGELVLDQVMPVTAEGLSGMTMVHHQLHSTRPTARSCVECHRTSATWGMGSSNFVLGRQLAFVADRRGIEVVALDRRELARSIPLLKIPLADVVDVAVHTDELQGHAHHLYAAEGGRGVHVVDVTNPLEPRTVAFVATLNPLGLELVGDLLYVADGIGGLRIFDVSEPAEIHALGHVPSFEAHDVEVKWPWAYLADGPGGLAIVDVRVPIAPRLLHALDLDGDRETTNEAIVVESLFQYSRPTADEEGPLDRRTRARNLCAVLDRRGGVVLVDVTEPTRPDVLFPELEGRDERSRSSSSSDATYRGLALLSQVDPAEAQGGDRTRERDYAYVLVERGSPENRRSTGVLLDVSDPRDVAATRSRDRPRFRAGYATEQLVVADFYNPPFRKRVVFTPGELGVLLTDVSTSREPVQIGQLIGITEAYAVGVEEFPLDRMIDEKGRRLKDISRDDSRWLYRTEVDRILGVSAEELGTHLYYDEPPPFHGETAHMHLRELDRDGSGLLEGEELERAGGATDDNRDGRIAMIELARHAGLLGEEARRSTPTRDTGEAMIAGRVFRDGDLARLLDGVDPFVHDANRDGALDRREAGHALFTALDLDGDGGLTPDELSRHPGDLRQLRYGDRAGEELFRSLEKTADRRISRAEFRIQDAEWRALDADGDGGVLLLESRLESLRERGFPADGSEWPTRRRGYLPLPPGLRPEQLLAAFDDDGDEVLRRGELAARPELLGLLDRDRNGRVSREELTDVLDRAARAGVDGTPDDFLGRWDLDRSGAIEDDELPEVVRLRLEPHLSRRR
jgi:Ca2+-binding EF-hand superfamily protein